MVKEALFNDFIKLDIRVGTVKSALVFPEARNPSYKLEIDFGEPLGTKKSSAQITARYHTDELIGKQVLAVVNLPPRQIGPFMSEVLTLGVSDESNDVLLVVPEQAVPNGAKLH